MGYAVAVCGFVLALGIAACGPADAGRENRGRHPTLSATDADTAWILRDSLSATFCEPPKAGARSSEIPWPDSASAVAAARRLFSDRLAGAHVKVRTLARTPDGVFIQFADDQASLDGTASVYVRPGLCVTWLGW